MPRGPAPASHQERRVGGAVQRGLFPKNFGVRRSRSALNPPPAGGSAGSSAVATSRRRSRKGGRPKPATLTLFVQALAGSRVVVELRGGARVSGTLESAQDDLGIWLRPFVFETYPVDLPPSAQRAFEGPRPEPQEKQVDLVELEISQGARNSESRESARRRAAQHDEAVARLCESMFISGTFVRSIETLEVSVPATLAAHETKLQRVRSVFTRTLRK